jgi:hypothetical protein
MRVLAQVLAPLRHSWRPAAIGLLCAVAGLAQAQSSLDDGSGDPPNRVARLSYISGDLGFLPAGSKDWSDGSINRPLTTGDRLSSGQASRAELEIGGGTLRIDGKTDLAVLDLTDQVAQIELTQGTLNLNVRHLDAGQSYEIDTPTVALVVDQPGTFRVDTGDNGQGTQVTAFDGSATVYGENSTQRTVNAGRSYRFDDSSLQSVAISDVGDGDAFDAWSNQRDRRYERSPTRRYVSDDVVGYQDLDRYGDWQDTGDYGEVWYPAHQAADWAPYRDGHWAYIAPWGWSWVDDSPWGFAPYHYGRWAYTDRGWGWIPGPREERAIYAPALVAFVGGGGFSIGIGAGPVGWFPLGPGEIYNPWYGCDRSYYSRVNVTNIRVTNVYNNTTIINNINNHYSSYRDNRPLAGDRYVNRAAPRGFTAIPAKAFAGGQHVQRDLLHVDPRQLASARVQPRGVGVTPLAGMPAATHSANVQALPLNGFRRQVVARRAPPLPAAERRVGTVHNTLLPVNFRGPSNNVRLLGAQADRVGRFDPAAPRGLRGAPLPVNPRTSVLQDEPRARNVLPNPALIRRTSNVIDQPRPGELPSARFAHPQPGAAFGRSGVEQGRPMPVRAPLDTRSGVPEAGVRSISNAGDSQPHGAYRGTPTLPQVPQIQRAAPSDPYANANERNQRFDPTRGYHSSLPSVEPIHNTMVPRAQHTYDNPQGNLHEPSRSVTQPSPPTYQPRFQPQPQAEQQPRFQPQPREMQQPRFQPPPREMQQPRFQPPPREMQQPRFQPPPQAAPQRQYQPQMQARPPQAEPRPAPEPRGRPVPKDDRQH